MLLWGERGGLGGQGAQLRAGGAAAPLQTPEHRLSGDGWCCLRDILADANGVKKGIPLTLISLEFELDSVSCPQMGSTIPGWCQTLGVHRLNAGCAAGQLIPANSSKAWMDGGKLFLAIYIQNEYKLKYWSRQNYCYDLYSSKVKVSLY